MNYSDILLLEASNLINIVETKNQDEPSELVTTVSIADTKALDDMKSKVDELVKKDDVSGLSAMLQTMDKTLRSDNPEDKETIIKLIPMVTTVVVALCKTRNGEDVSEHILAILKDCKTVLERLTIHGCDKAINKINETIEKSENTKK